MDALRVLDETAASEPDNAQVLCSRGDVLTDLGRYGAAIETYDAAIRIRPDQSELYDFKGIALALDGRLEEALFCLDQALEIAPDSLNTMNNRANVLKKLGRLDEAVQQFDSVIARLPNFAPAHNNKGSALVALRRFDEAIASFDLVLEFDPAQIEARTNRAGALVRAGRLEEAADAYRGILAIYPDHVESLLNLGELLAALGKADDALGNFAQILASYPDNVDALFGRPLAFAGEMRFDEAVPYYKRILEIDRNHVGALDNLGIALVRLGRLTEALHYYDHAIETEPANAYLWRNRSTILRELNDLEEALTSLDRALAIDPALPQAFEMRLHIAAQLAQWDQFDREVGELSDRIAKGLGNIAPFPLLALSDDPQLHRTCAEDYCRRWNPPSPAGNIAWHRGSRGQLRIGYFSADFHSHATMHLFLETLQAHDRERLKLFAFSFGPPIDDEAHRGARAAFDEFIDVRSMSDQAVVHRARELQLDIGVDLKGYTKDSRWKLFSGRPAPVQVSYLGYPATMGNPYIDYILADRVLIPFGSEQFYSEKIVFLPGSYQPNGPIREIVPRAKRSDYGLPDQTFVYCCFNNNYKITPDVFSTWMRILKATQGSILWLWVDHASARRNLRQHATDSGVDAERIIFVDRAEREGHLDRLRLADLFLDTLPYNAHTTASDALRVGLPLLTCAGQSFAARVAASLLTEVGLPELVTTSLEAYEDLAVQLGTDPQRTAILRAKLSRKLGTSSLFDPAQMARKLEAAFFSMHERRMNDLSMDHIYL